MEDHKNLQDDEYAKGDQVWVYRDLGYFALCAIECTWYERNQKFYLVKDSTGTRELVHESFLMLECRASDVLQPSN